MKNLRNSFERFCYRHYNKGIPNLMLYICLGSGIVYLMSMINGGTFLYELLCFDKALILKGQVWRLFSYVLTYTPGSSFLAIIFLYFFYSLSRGVEMSMGTFRFNLYYLSGVILMDIFAMFFCPTTDTVISGLLVPAEYFTYGIYANMAYYLHLSMLLTFATTNPDSQFLIFFIIPVKAWFMGLLYLVLIGIEIYNLSPLFPHNLFPLIALGNYLLFAGKGVLNLFPFIRHRIRKKPTMRKASPIPFSSKSSAQKHADYTHRCTVCGRTDVSNPELEFRYCSRCNGYYCYCQDHINNHAHID